MNPVDLVEATVKRRAAYANVDDAAVRQFATDMISQNAHIHRLDRRVLAVACKVPIVFLNGWLRRLTPPRVRNAFDALERTIISDFLLAVGFFESDIVDGQRLHYDGLHRSNRNVFARFD